MTYSSDELVDLLRQTTVALVRREGPDLTARQLAVLLICYLDDRPDHTVRRLATILTVSKPAITRALDRLGDLDLARREVDPADRRSIVVRRTIKGDSFLRDLRAIMAAQAAEHVKKGKGATVLENQSAFANA